MKRALANLGLLVVLTAAPGLAQEEAARLRSAATAIDLVVAQSMEEHLTPGLALAVTSREALLHLATYGFADLKKRQPVTPDTLFQIGSISKSFTAIALLQLTETGQLPDLQAPLTDYLPWFRVNSEHRSLTAHDLLSHTGAIPCNRDDISSSPFMAWAVREQSTAWPPGERFHYSNIGYQTLHVLLEQRAEASWAEVVSRAILEPLGMTRSVPAITNDMRQRQAVAYLRMYDDRPGHRSHPLVEAPFFPYFVGDGCIAAPPEELATYTRMLLNRGQGPAGRLLSPASFATFQTAWIVDDDDDDDVGYGYGIGVANPDGRHQLRHSGGMVGFSAQMIGDLTWGLGVVVLVNGPGAPREVAEYALAAIHAAIADQPLPPLPEVVDPGQVANAADFAGTYSTGDGRRRELVARAGQLRLLHADQEIVLEHRDDDIFQTPHPDFDRFLLVFSRNSEGQVVELSHGPDWFLGPAYDGPKEFTVPEAFHAYQGHYYSYSPWLSNFKVFIRKGTLYLSTYDGGESEVGEEILVAVGPDRFQIGAGPTPETMEFDAIVDGKALRASYNGHPFFRIRQGTRKK